MKDYNFSHTLLTKMDCMKKVEYYLNRTAQSYSPSMGDGIRLHKHCEEYLGGKRGLQFRDDDEEAKFEKIRPYLDSIYNKVVFTEKKFELFNEGLGKVVAVFDAGIQEQNGLWLVDWKFTDKGWNERKFQGYKESQALLYLWVAGQQLNHPPLGMIYVVVSNEHEVPTHYYVMVTEEELDKALRNYKSKNAKLQAAIRTNIFESNPSYMCNWCDYRTICPDRHVKKEQSVPMELPEGFRIKAPE